MYDEIIFCLNQHSPDSIHIQNSSYQSLIQFSFLNQPKNQIQKTRQSISQTMLSNST